MPSIFYETMSNFPSEIIYLIIFMLGLVLLCHGIETGIKYFKTKILPPWREVTERLLTEPGYVPPKPTKFSATALYLFCQLLGFMQVGPRSVFGKNRLPDDGSFILVSNHVDMGDGASIQDVLTDNVFDAEPVTYPIAHNEMKGFIAWGGAKSGALAIFHETDKGRHKGLKAMITAFTSRGPNVHLPIFPEAMLVHNEEILRSRFTYGLLTLAKKAARVLGIPIPIVCMIIHYKRDPRDATIFHWLLQFLFTGIDYKSDPSKTGKFHRLLKFVFGIKKFRNLFGHDQNYGAIVVVGKPFYVLPPDYSKASDYPASRILPDDKELATDIYVKEMFRLQQVAFKKCMPWKDSECNCAKLRRHST